MDSRKWLMLGGIVLAAGLGCSRKQTVPTDPYSPVPATPPARQATNEPEPRPGRRRGKDVAAKETDGKPSNISKIADAQADAARDPLGSSEQRQKALALAKQNYRRAIQLDPKYLLAYIGLAQACGAAGEHEQAIHTLDAGLAKMPKEPQLWHERGMALGRLKRFDDATKNLQQAVQLDSDNTLFAKSLGLMLARQGKADEAVPWLKRGMREADARYNIARMMRHIDNVEESDRQLRLALEAEPAHPAALAMIEEGNAPSAPPASETIKLATHVSSAPPSPLPAASPLRIIVDPPATFAPPAPDALPQRPAVAAPTRKETAKPAVRISFEPNE